MSDDEPVRPRLDRDRAVVATCPARAALAGNPSDGYGGAVVAVPVDAVAASVRVTPADSFEIHHSPTADDTFESLDELAARVDRHGYGDARTLVIATLRSLRRHLGAEIEPARIEVASTIPRSVGLAGSSAIIIATMRALMSANPPSSWTARLTGDVALQASIALDVETSELGITAGLQDRVVQCFGSPVFMDFSDDVALSVGGLFAGRYRRLPDPPGPVFVAVLDSSASPSDSTHRSLRADHRSGRNAVRRAMDDLAEHGREAATAFDRGDVAALGAAMDATLDVRRSMMVLDPRHLAMADAARSVGCHANWSGSGGAVTVLAPNDAVADTARGVLTTDLGCTIIAV